MPGIEAQAVRPRPVTDIAAIAFALAASVALSYLVTGNALLTLAFGGGLVMLGLTAFVGARSRPHVRSETRPPEIDWSVTLAAVEQAGLVVAITDRANRLVCASPAYEERFGTAAPPRLDLGEEASDLLARLARTAWREGRGETQAVAGSGLSSTILARTAGAAEDHLVWLFCPEHTDKDLDTFEALVRARLGRVLSGAGIAAALVGPDGIVGAANAAFASRARGDAEADLTGDVFADQLRTDERERIFFAREGRKGAPQILVEVPLAGAGGSWGAGPSSRGEGDSEAAGEGADGGAAEPGGLMLLFELGIGHGSWDADGGAGAPQLEALVERLPLGLAAIGRDGRLLYANPAFRRAAGIAGPTGEGRLPPFPSDLVVPADKVALADAVRRYSQGATAGADMTVRLLSEPEEPVSLGLTGVRGLGEVAMLLSLADMTEENRLKRQVAQATKMQAVGQLAGGVAHDFNNVLTAIIGTCDLMLERHAAGDADFDDIQQIRNNSNRAASLTRQLLAFSRQQTLKPEIIQLPDVLSGMTHLLQRLLGARIELNVRHDRDLGPVRADPRQLEQVIMNLAVNARDAIQERGGGEQATGTLSFATRSMDAVAIRKLGHDIIPEGDYTVLEARDTGGGIPPRVLGKIFEPFFTTKEMGKGTGLGLSTVYGIVKQSGGFIFADNVLEADGTVHGARFTMFLPVHAASAEELRRLRAAPEPQPDRARGWSGGGRILLVEDEDMVRAVAERALAREGYSIVAARDGEEGLEAFRASAKSGTPFDLVLSDVVMPGTGGPAMARTIREEAPGMPVLFMSGYAEGQLRDEIDLAAVHFIAKPFSVRQIADKVGAVLAERARRH